MKPAPLLLIGLAVGAAVGWFGHSRLAPVVEVVQRVDPMLGILRQALAKVSAHDVAVTDSARAALDSFHAYQERYHGLLVTEQQAETVFVRAARDPLVSRDSTVRLCAVVILTCQQRAKLAEGEAQFLRDKLAAQITLQPRRWSIGIFTGIGFDGVKFRAWPPMTGVGVNFRLR